MPSFESINEKLQIAAEKLDQAANEIRDLPLEPIKEHIVGIGEALANIFQIQHEIYRLRPDLQPEHLAEEAPEPDPDLTSEQRLLVEKLSKEEIQKIDDLLLFHAQHSWRKVAMLVGLAMMDQKRPKGVPDIFYSQRVRKLVGEGRLESQGNLQYMRFSEVRLPDGNNTQET
jgi:hypothetical protein